MKSVEETARYLKERSLQVVTAESCTAGLIAALLADVPGAGGLLDSAFVAYSPQSKVRCLQVSQKTLRDNNLTSEIVAREMALGALQNACVQIAVSNTGVADNTDPDIPAGTQCFAWALRLGQGEPAIFSETRKFSGGRHAIREASAQYAISRIIPYHQICLRCANLSG